MTFSIGPKDLRRELYANFAVIECMLLGKPIYLGSCRQCGHIVVTLQRVDTEISADPLLKGMDHLRGCLKGVHITEKTDEGRR